MTPITFEELKLYTPWVERLLVCGNSELLFNKDRTKVRAEYEDKHGAVESARDMEDALKKYFGPDHSIAVSRHNQLFTSSLYTALAERRNLFIESMRPLMSDIDVVVELGAGFGQNIHSMKSVFPDKRKDM